MLHRKKGFTLIEMMIVIAIIALLATIAIPNYINFQKRAKTAEAKANLGSIRTTEEAYKAEHDVYRTAPANPGSIPSATTAAWTTGDADWEAIGFEPKGDVRYQYQITSTDTSANFTATAKGDLDGDSTYSTFTITEAGTSISETSPLE
jgi:type IV pilus assembly protein PilA